MSTAVSNALTAEQVAQAAQLLATARKSGAPLQALPEACRPKTIAEGYQIQHAVTRLLGYRLAGWKVGFTSPHVQAKRGLTEPIIGRLYEPCVYRSPAVVRGIPHMLVLDPEIAFRLASDLPARARPYGREEILVAVEYLVPVIEVGVSSFRTWPKVDTPSLIADNGSHAGLVQGEPVPDWQRLDLAKQEVSLMISGKELVRGSGAEVMGDPINALVWFVNTLSRRGENLRAGELITTGTLIDSPKVAPDVIALADFGRLGRVGFQFIA